MTCRGRCSQKAIWTCIREMLLIVSYMLKVYFATNVTCSKTEAPGEILIPWEFVSGGVIGAHVWQSGSSPSSSGLDCVHTGQS